MLNRSGPSTESCGTPAGVVLEVETPSILTKEIELLGLLNNEKTKLTRLVQHQEEKRLHLESVAGASEQFKQDISKLKEIVRTQHNELQILNDEIKILKTKGLQPRPELTVMYKTEEVEEEEELELMELDETDDVIEFDYVLADREIQHVSIISKEKESTLIAKDIVLEMLDDLNIDKASIKDLDLLVSDVLQKDSIALIIEELLAIVPYEPKDTEQNVLEIVAEKIYALKDNESTETEYAVEILNNILQKTVLRSEIVEDIGKMLNELIEQLPTSFILQKNIILSIVDKITSSYTDIKKEEFTEAVLNLTTSQREGVEIVLQHILEQVYGSGIDYLYYIKDT
ncbi:hypothetical protein Trydic_g7735 [Trypoxylus dichotomus]